MNEVNLSIFSFISLIVLSVVYYFLISEKLNKVLVAMYGAVFLIFMQVFRDATHTSQENALLFVSKNLDVLGFVIGMMILVGIVRESGIFEAAALSLVKLVQGRPRLLLIALAYLTMVMTVFLSNIPTMLILAPILFVLIRELKLPFLPYLLTVVTFANISGSMTPISDPTTYYQAKTVGLGFMEVVTNSGLIALAVSVVTILFVLVVFHKQLSAVHVSKKDVAAFKPMSAIRNKRTLAIGLPLLVGAILLMTLKEWIFTLTGATLDNATITLTAGFFAMFIFHREPKKIFSELIDWETVFFFLGLFVVVGALEFTHVVPFFAQTLISWTGGSMTWLLAIVSMGSGVLSTFIDNVPYNITMVGAIQEMAKTGIVVYPLWWALNLGTSIGGAGSPIGAACNVIAFSQAEKENIHVPFFKYLAYGLPLVLINSFTAFIILVLKYHA
ncbi:MAG: SLC13 family permease [Candidatus Uhrbacteria bacterium]